MLLDRKQKGDLLDKVSSLVERELPASVRDSG